MSSSSLKENGSTPAISMAHVEFQTMDSDDIIMNHRNERTDDNGRNEEVIDDSGIIDSEMAQQNTGNNTCSNSLHNHHHNNNDNDKRYEKATECTNATNSATATANTNTNATVFEAGDHVYVWCHAGVYQHHGIVLQVNPDGSLLIADFTNLGPNKNQNNATHHPPPRSGDDDERDSIDDGVIQGHKHHNNNHTSFIQSTKPCTESSQTASRSASVGLVGGFRFVQETDPHHKWCKVKYQASLLECLTWRPGTCSSAKPLSVDQILARVHFLMMHHDEYVPPYHVLCSNCETVAVWCTTGQWRTLQVSHALNWTKGIVPLGTYWGVTAAAGATTTTTTTSAAGILGWIGTTTTEVSLVAANPIILPAICVAGVAVGGVTLWNTLRIRKQWSETCTLLNTEFDRFWTNDDKCSGVKLVRIDVDEYNDKCIDDKQQQP